MSENNGPDSEEDGNVPRIETEPTLDGQPIFNSDEPDETRERIPDDSDEMDD